MGLSETLHLELADAGIGVSVLCPGPVATDIVTRSAKVRPAERERPSEEQRELVAQRLALWTRILQAGVSPDAVGEMVLDAVLDDRLYIHTDRLMAYEIEARAKALLAAMPEA